MFTIRSHNGSKPPETYKCMPRALANTLSYTSFSMTIQPWTTRCDTPASCTLLYGSMMGSRRSDANSQASGPSC